MSYRSRFVALQCSSDIGRYYYFFYNKTSSLLVPYLIRIVVGGLF